MVTPGLGFLYNNAMINSDPVPRRPNSIAAGKSRITQMAPTMVFKDGQPQIVVGALGRSRIVGAVAETIINIIDR